MWSVSSCSPGVFGAPDNLGNPYAAVVSQQDASIGKPDQEFAALVNLGWNSDYANVHVDAFADVFSPQQHDDQRKNTLMKERIRIDRMTSELVFQPCIQTPTPLRDECVLAVREELNLHLTSIC